MPPEDSATGDRDEPSVSIGVPEVAQLLIEHRAALLGYLLSCVRHFADAEDLFQDVSLAAIQSAGDLRTREGFLPWAREIARRRVLAHFRKSKRMAPIDPELATRLAETAAEIDVAREVPERIEALRACLDALPLESRKLIALRYEDHRRPVEKIAEKFGRSVQATYAILKRSRLLLRDCVDQKLSQGA
ncbi:MAG: sigma-70 family RNA polymerase sigma factor [Verrucomicrobiota bacterium]